MKRTFKKVEVGNFWIAVKGESIEGEVISKDKTINTSFGEMEYIELANDETGEITNVGISGGLTMVMPHIEIGDYIKITFTGEKVNPKTKRTYKAFEVAIAE